MSQLPLLLILSSGAGLSIFLGALFAAHYNKKGNHLSPFLEHGILAFGGGALIAAVGLVLVPDGLQNQPVWLAALTFLLGGFIFLQVDRYLHQRGTPIGQLIAMMLDFIPESIVLGAVISMDMMKAVFLAIIIAAQNLPEGFAAFQEICKSSGDKSTLQKFVLPTIALCVLVGPIAALFGLYVCSSDDLLLGVLMTFCSGGILYIVFRDIAPAANLEKSWTPSFGAVMGFTVGLVGFGVIH